jgi:hypothetical protein
MMVRQDVQDAVILNAVMEIVPHMEINFSK